MTFKTNTNNSRNSKEATIMTTQITTNTLKAIETAMVSNGYYTRIRIEHARVRAAIAIKKAAKVKALKAEHDAIYAAAIEAAEAKKKAVRKAKALARYQRRAFYKSAAKQVVAATTTSTPVTTNYSYHAWYFIMAWVFTHVDGTKAANVNQTRIGLAAFKALFLKGRVKTARIHNGYTIDTRLVAPVARVKGDALAALKAERWAWVNEPEFVLTHSVEVSFMVDIALKNLAAGGVATMVATAISKDQGMVEIEKAIPASQAIGNARLYLRKQLAEGLMESTHFVRNVQRDAAIARLDKAIVRIEGKAVKEAVKTATECKALVPVTEPVFNWAADDDTERAERVTNKGGDVEKKFFIDLQLFAEKKEEENMTKVNLVTANAEALMSLPGVGEKMAQKIMNFRASNALNSVDDLKMVAGISDKFVAKIRDLVVVEAAPKATKVKGNSEAQEFSMKVMRNNIDRRAIRFQSLCITGGNTKYEEPLCMHTDFSSFGMNDITRDIYEHATEEGSNVFVKGGNVCVLNNIVSGDCIKQPFTDKLLQLEMREADSKLASTFVEAIKKSLVTIQYTMDGKVYVHVDHNLGNGEHIFNTWCIAGDDDAFIEENNAVRQIWKLGGVFKSYGCIYAGPSNQRQVTAILFKMNKEESELPKAERVAAFSARVFKELGNMAGGITKAIEEMVNAKEKMAMEEAFKLNSRLSLAFTPNTKTFGFESFAFYKGKLGMADGQYLVNADMLAAYYGLDIEGVLGLALQGRVLTGMVAKGMGIPTLNKDMDIIVAEFAMNGKVVHIDYHTFRKMWVMDKLDADVLYVVGKGSIGCFFDKNSLKCVGSETDVWRLEDGFTYSMLEVRRATEGKLNSQDAACMQHLDGMVDFVRDLGKAHIDESLAEIEAIFSGKTTDKVVNPDGYYPSLISQICPSYAAQDSGLMETIIKDKVNSLVTAIEHYSFKLGEGDQYRYLQSDYADMLLGTGVLPNGKVYTPGMKAGIKVVLTRNPRADIVEFYLAETVSLEYVLERIAELDCTDAMKNVIARMFKYACTGLVITPADPKLPASLGGSDFDGDGCTVHTNKRFVEIAKKQPEGSNVIPGAPESGKFINKYGVDEMMNMMVDGIFGQKNEKTGKRITPTPIGILANHAMKLLAMAMLSDEELENIIELIVRPNVKALGFKQETREYERMFDTPDVEIHNEDVMESTKSYYTSDLSVTSTRAYLADCARMGASVEGRGIDVNKTAELVFTGYFGVVSRKDIIGEPIKRKGIMSVKCLDVCRYESFFTRNEEGKLEMSAELQKPQSDSVYLISSALTPVRDELMAYLVGRVNELFAREIPAAASENILLAARGRSKVDMADLDNLSKIHAMTTGNDQLQSEDKKNFRRAVANTVRCAFDSNADVIDMFAAIKRAAFNEKTGKYSSFEHVLHEEYLQGVLYVAKCEGYNVNSTVGYPAVARDFRFVVDGEEVHMYGGESLDGNIVADAKINGVWTVAVKNGHVYLVRDAVEHFAVPACTDEVIVRCKSFNKDKNVNDFNNRPSLCDKDSFARIKIDNYRQCLILNKEGTKSWNIFVPTTKKDGDRMPKIVETRLNKKLHGNGVRIDNVFQWVNGSGNTDTVIAGRFVRVSTPLPKLNGHVAAKVVVPQVNTNAVPSATEILDF